MRHVPHEIASDLHLVARFATTTFISIVNELASDCAFFCSFEIRQSVMQMQRPILHASSMGRRNS